MSSPRAPRCPPGSSISLLKLNICCIVCVFVICCWFGRFFKLRQAVNRFTHYTSHRMAQKPGLRAPWDPRYGQFRFWFLVWLLFVFACPEGAAASRVHLAVIFVYSLSCRLKRPTLPIPPSQTKHQVSGPSNVIRRTKDTT